jgi:hypothetical protein
MRHWPTHYQGKTIVLQIMHQLWIQIVSNHSLLKAIEFLS